MPDCRNIWLHHVSDVPPKFLGGQKWGKTSDITDFSQFLPGPKDKKE